MTSGVQILAVMPGGMEGVDEIGCIGDVVQARGGVLHWVYRLRGDPLPESPFGFDGLIVLGGEIGAHETQYAGYFEPLLRLIRAFHAQGKPVFGSCLGAQSIACAFGGRAVPQGFFEFGFEPLHPEPAARSDPLLGHAPETVHLFEMHYDTLTLPTEAVLLLRGEKVPNQAFRVGETTYGFQCHFEATRDIVAIWKRRELSNDARYTEAGLASAMERIDRQFAQFGRDQLAFGTQVVNRWMDLFGRAS